MAMRILATCLLASAGLTVSCVSEPPVDLVLHHGNIVTVDPSFRIVQAVAVRGERIAAVGGNDEILSLASPETTRVDLAGRTLLPGLIDSHVHSQESAVFEFDHQVPDMETIQDVLAYVKARAEAVGPGKWVRVSQVFITRLREQRYPTREELDRAAPKNPVVFRTGPDAALNSLALKLSGIDRNFKITDGQPGRIECDPKTGEPTGVLRSCARFIKYESAEKTPTPEDRLRCLRELFRDYNSVGITSFVDGDTSDEELDLFRRLKERRELTCRIFVALSVDGQAPLQKIEARLAEAAKSPLHQYDNLLWLRGAKCFLDGGMLTGSAYMLRPWGVSSVYAITDPEYRGMLFIPPERLYQIMRLALQHGFQFTAHSVGDGAVYAFLDACARINRDDFPVRDKRPCITHANFSSPEAIQRMAELGVTANMQPAWLWLDAATLLGHFGNERLAYFQPYKTIFEHGVTVGGGSDHMQKVGSLRSINPYNPFLGMWVTLTRKSRWMSEPLHPEQAITREQAIRFYTTNNAYLTFEEKEKGSIEAGKLADLVVVDKDILTCPIEEVKDIQVEETYLGGKLVFRR
jgi:predicted amidohydrolase YtcJ